MRKSVLLNPIFLMAVGLNSLSAKAVDHGFIVSVNPYAGAGRDNIKSDVEHSSGARAVVERRFVVFGKHTTIAPQFVIGDGYFELERRSDVDGRKIISTYDNRFVLGGLKAGHLYGDAKLPNEVYGAFQLGMGQTKLSEAESGEGFYADKNYRNIKGPYAALEIGTLIQLKPRLHFMTGILAQRYEADQSRASGGVEGDSVQDNGRFALTTDQRDSLTPLDPKVVQESLGVMAGMSFGF